MQSIILNRLLKLSIQEIVLDLDKRGIKALKALETCNKGFNREVTGLSSKTRNHIKKC